MILMLRGDDHVMVLFGSVDEVSRRLETIDIENDEYQFCDVSGQRYVGVVTRPIGRFSSGAFELRTVGPPEIGNAVELIDRATGLEANEWYKDLASLRRHLTSA